MEGGPGWSRRTVGRGYTRIQGSKELGAGKHNTKWQSSITRKHGTKGRQGKIGIQRLSLRAVT